MQQRRVCPLFPTLYSANTLRPIGGRSEDEIASAISEAQCNFSGIGVSPPGADRHPPLIPKGICQRLGLMYAACHNVCGDR